VVGGEGRLVSLSGMATRHKTLSQGDKEGGGGGGRGEKTKTRRKKGEAPRIIPGCAAGRGARARKSKKKKSANINRIGGQTRRLLDWGTGEAGRTEKCKYK